MNGLLGEGKSLRVLIDALAPTAGGGESYLRGLLPALGRADPAGEYWVLQAPWQRFWDFALPDNMHLLSAPLPQRRSVLKRFLWQQLRLPEVIHGHRIDVLFCPTEIACLTAPCKTVLGIQNLNPYVGGLLHRSWAYYVNRKIILRSLTWISTRRSRQVIFVSDFARREVCRQLRIPISKTEVIYHGLGPIFLSDRPAAPEWLGRLPRPYLLSVSAIAAHKNYPFLVRAFVEAVRRSGIPHQLVVAGAPLFQKHVQEMRQIADDAGLGGRLHLLGSVPYNDLPALYRQADLFVFPSLLEVFGFPLIEAMASGVPVAASNATSSEEICGDAAVYFDPTDVGAAVEKISQALADPLLRTGLVSRGRVRAADFTWETTAEKTMAVFETALSGPA